jgi:hypothetical protein
MTKKRLRENPDFQAVLAEELEKANGGGECKCKECRGHARQCNDALKQQNEVLMDWKLAQSKYSLVRIGMQDSINNMQDSINSLEKGVINSIKRSRRTKAGEQLSH